MKKKTKRELAREDYIRETQMFQRIAGVPESTDEELGKDFDSIKCRAS